MRKVLRIGTKIKPKPTEHEKSFSNEINTRIEIARGNKMRKIFDDKKGFQRVLIRLGDILSGTQTICCARTIVRNHFDLFLQTGTFSIATIMQCLLTGYAIYFDSDGKLMKIYFS